MKKADEYHEIMWAERETNCYDGDNCDDLTPEWGTYCEGDKEGETFKETLTLDPKQFPPGTKVTVSVPVCPLCHQPVECCKANEHCDFDWDEWELSRYS